jgi:hypothetical protein
MSLLVHCCFFPLTHHIMSSQAILSALRSLAHGNPEAFAVAAAAIYARLQDKDSVTLNDLLGKVMLGADARTLAAFDGMMNMFCTEPLSQTFADERQWRVYALTTLLRYPDSLHLTRLGDMTTLDAELAALLNVPAERVKCDPLVLPGWVVYGHGPVEAFEQCQASKAWADGQVFPDPRAAMNNAWLHPETSQRVDEAVFLVNVFCSVDESQDILAGLERAASTQPTLMLEAPMESGPAVPVRLMVLDAGGAWNQFNEALHTVDVFHLGGALRMLGHNRQVPMHDMVLVAAYVEEDNEDHHSLRVSVLHKDTGELLAGMIFCDLHEPEYFLMRTDELLQAFKVSPVQRLEPTFYEAELEQSGDTHPRFFVPGAGWMLAPEII